MVGTIYRPPDENVTDFLDSLRKLLSTTTGEDKICYVMGDFNLDLLRHEQHAVTGLIFPILKIYGKLMKAR